jgi:hypothetical protein
MQTATETQGLKIQPVNWEESRKILADKFNDREHWILIVHSLASRLLVEIEQRYYTGEKSRDWTMVVAEHCGQSFTVVAARKRHMHPYQFASLLRQVIKIHMGERDLLKRYFQIMAPSEAMDLAYEVADRIFESWRLKFSERKQFLQR